MRMLVLLAGMVFSALPGAPVAQTIYKCKAADGSSIYSQQPCGSDAHKVRLAPEHKLSAEDQARVDAQRARFADESRENALARRERECVGNMTSGQIARSEQRIREYREQQTKLQAQLRRAANNLAGATWESGLREQISGLDQNIAAEQSAQTQALANARTVCSARRSSWAADMDSPKHPKGSSARH